MKSIETSRDPGWAGSPSSGREHRLFLIVDGHSYVYRAFHAIRQLNAPDGRPTNAIYGFIKMLGKLRTRFEPTHLAVVWDGGLCSERLAVYPGYKASRAAMPSLLEAQMDEVFAFLRASQIASLCRDGIEADDWIAGLTARAVADEIEVVIATSDKDFMQLAGPLVGLFSPHDKTETIMRAPEVRLKMGVEPRQIVDYLSLIGDSVDNIPGVAGVGPKTAAELLRQFGSLENLWPQIDEVEPEKLRANLQARRDDLRRNQSIIRLRTELPDEFVLGEFEVGQADTDELQNLYHRWGFKALAEALGTASPALF